MKKIFALIGFLVWNSLASADCITGKLFYSDEENHQYVTIDARGIVIFDQLSWKKNKESSFEEFNPKELVKLSDISIKLVEHSRQLYNGSEYFQTKLSVMQEGRASQEVHLQLVESPGDDPIPRAENPKELATGLFFHDYYQEKCF